MTMTTRPQRTASRKSALTGGFDSLTLDPSIRLRLVRQQLVGDSQETIGKAWRLTGQALDQYEQVHPGLAERIVTMAETVTTGEIKTRDKLATAEIDQARVGQSLAFLLTIIALGAAIYFFAVHNVPAGGLLISFPVIMLIRSFLTGHREDSGKPDSGDTEATEEP